MSPGQWGVARPPSSPGGVSRYPGEGSYICPGGLDAPQEIDDGRVRRRRRVVEDEVPHSVEYHEVGVRELASEAVRGGDRDVAVLGSPQQQDRDPERRQAALVGRELAELPGAVELELAAPARLVGEGLEVLVERAVVHPPRL